MMRSSIASSPVVLGLLAGAVWIVPVDKVVAQEEAVPQDARVEAMERLDYMVGVWEGRGWIQRGDTRSEFRGSERIESKLGGSALVVEGRFLGRPPGARTEIPVHATLGVIWYEPSSEEYHFTTWVAGSDRGDRPLEVLENGWRWSMETPDGGRVRYTMELTPDGTWFEEGMYSADGGDWAKFFEMRLRKP